MQKISVNLIKKVDVLYHASADGIVIKPSRHKALFTDYFPAGCEWARTRIK
jgi:hypothetical protein